MTTRTYRALLVANSTFPSDSNLAELEGPRNDPALLRDALSDPRVGLVPSDNIRLVTERTMSEVLRELEGFLAAGTRDDTLILYYSGHGVLSEKRELYLCTRDTDTSFVKSTAVKASDVREMIADSAAGTTVILLDCCYSGRFKGGDLPATLSGSGTFVVTSSRPGELANDTDTRNRASLFTHHLVEGLMRGAEDRDGDGIVTLNDVYDYVHAELTELGRQVPQRHFEGDGHVPLAQRSREAITTHEELLDPAREAPVLDIPVARIDIGEIEEDVTLPPERVAIVNRGGGTLEWTFESASDWIVAAREGNELVLRLRPALGRHLGSVYVRDETTGVVKTVRVALNVVPRATKLAEPGEHRGSSPPAGAQQTAVAPTTAASPPAWYPDPTRRFEYRYWDGTRWTDRVSRTGRESRDPLEPSGSPSDGSGSVPSRHWGGRSLRFFVTAGLCAWFAYGAFATSVEENDLGNVDAANTWAWVGLGFVAATIVFLVIAIHRRRRFLRRRLDVAS